MNPPLGLFLSCCERLLAGDAELIGQLRDHGFVCASGTWQFRLPALHAYLMTRLPPGERVDYRGFLRELYASDLNTRLGELGAQIAVVDNLGKVDLSTYALRRLTI
ncbi:hypothetical protein [Pseudomonas sp.]|uniref:hypothetical protein n=1 Tax=Pseudomonas sp. TaxID=306 RepID=UPI003C784EA2